MSYEFAIIRKPSEGYRSLLVTLSKAFETFRSSFAGVWRQRV